ncbi:MAG: class I SAM-dependent methyltransferase [bacterium]|nr:class I SAM-dependent methyltransferase [bacterium]
MNQQEQLQQAHYNRIFHAYEAHYDDACSQRYRERFFFKPMFRGVALGNVEALDAMCGGGSATGYLLTQGARVTGLDISEAAVELYRRRWPQCRAIRSSVLSSGFPNNAFGCVAIIGGLHHLHPEVPAALQEIHRILKPGGILCFVEPHQGSLPDRVRRRWYPRDPLFERNERAIDLEAIKSLFSDRFLFRQEKYGGSIAYLFVLNSLVLRIPLGLKHWYTPLLLAIEATLSPLLGKQFSCFTLCQWEKR